MIRLINKLLILILLLIQSTPSQWKKIDFSPYEADFLISIINYKNKIYAADYSKGILLSSNQGDSWITLNAGLTAYYTTYSVNNFYSDSSGLYVLNYDGLLKLNEDLNKWERFAFISGMISLAKLGNVYIGGVSGNGVYISSDNGITWSLNYLTAGEIWNGKSIIVLNNKFFTSGDNGVYYSSDSGISWQNGLNINTSQILLQNDTLFAATTEGIKFTINESETWYDVGPKTYYAKCMEKYKGKYFAGGDLAIKYYSSELMDWVPATRNSPDGFTSQVKFLKIIGDYLFSCNYGGLYRRDLSDFNKPDLSIPDTIANDYYNEEVGNETYIDFGIGNYGFDTLKIYNIISEDPNFIFTRTQMDIPPEWGYGIGLTYKLTDPGTHTTKITVISNDTIPKNSFIVSIKGLPIEFELSQNYPNPFNPDTKISYVLPSTQQTSLKVYNSIGELVQVLVDEIQDGGKYTVNFNSTAFAAGVYFYRLISGSNIQTKKMIFMK